MLDDINIQTQNNVFSVFTNTGIHKKSGISAGAPVYVSAVKTEQGKDVLDINKKSRKRSIFKSAAASSIFTAAIIGIIFGKGLGGSAVTSMKTKLASEIAEAGASSSRYLSYWVKKGASKLLGVWQAIANITPIKDIITDKVLNSNGVTEKFASGTRNTFKAVVDRTLGKKYDRAGSLIGSLTSMLKQFSIPNMEKLDTSQLISIKGEEKTLAQWLQILSEQTERLSQTFEAGFSLGARKARGARREGLLKNLRERLSRMLFSEGGIFKPSKYKTYMTQELSKDAQTALQKEIEGHLTAITNNIPNIHKKAKTMLGEFISMLKPGSSSDTKTIGAVRQKLKEFLKCSGINETKSREKISNEIISMLEDTLRRAAGSSNYTAAEKELLNGRLNDLKECLLSSDAQSKGALEHIMTIVRGLHSAEIKAGGEKIISDADFNSINKLSKKISSGMQEACGTEINKYFLKHAEMEIGSAATDVMGLMLPAGAGVYAMAKAKDKDERVSASLKTCIPLAGTAAAFVYGTTTMMSGGANLAFSIISGLLLNKAGTYIDNLYKKYKKTGSAAKTAAGEVKKMISNFEAPKSPAKPAVKKQYA